MEIKYVATVFFVLALVHTFCVSFIARWAKKFEIESSTHKILHILAEVEVVFGFWAFWFLLTWLVKEGPAPVTAYALNLNMTEPLFIFCIMVLAATKPVMSFAKQLVLGFSVGLERLIKINRCICQVFILLTVGPLLGSLITEPAAITIVAMLLYQMIDRNRVGQKLLYGLLAVLFVNISVGGALTHFAAPPILVVARTWGWTLPEVFKNLGYAGISTVVLNALLFVIIMREQISEKLNPVVSDRLHVPVGIIGAHLIFLAALVMTAHYPLRFLIIFMVFIIFTLMTKNFQERLKFKQSFLVGFFLAGLIIFGAFQSWWVEPVIIALSETALYVSAIGLTAITDNAALTYLGSQVESISELSKWALVSGALAGGGLTILANAPNPAGFSILSSKFPDSSLNAAKLFLAALAPTFVAGLCFYFL